MPLFRSAFSGLRDQQQRDAHDLMLRRDEWAGTTRVRMYRCETTRDGGLEFVELE